MEREYLMNDLVLLEKKFYKIIEVNLDEDSYFEVKVDGKEPVKYMSVRKWVQEFVKDGVYPDDKARFLKFFDPFMLKGKMKEKPQRVFYRRWIDGCWRWVAMEVLPMENFREDEPIVLILVIDVEDYIKDYKEQVEARSRLSVRDGEAKRGQ